MAQGLTSSPRDGLTADQVRWLLTGVPNPRYDRGLEVLDASLNVVADISAYFQGGTVTHTADATVHGTCNLTLRDGVTIDWGTRLLRPYLTITDGAVVARFNGGVFRAARPKADHTTTPATLAVTGSDRLSLLDRTIPDAYVVTAGTGVLAAVRQAVTDAGLDASTVRLDTTAEAKTMPMDKVWPQTLDTSAGGDALPPDVTAASSSATTWLLIINSLLAMVGYTGLWCDQDGLFRASPYVAPDARPVDYSLSFDDLTEVIVAPGRSDDTDQSNPVNVWIFVQQNLDTEPAEGAGQYTVRNQSTGPNSIDAQGGLEWVSVVTVDAVDQAALEVQGDAQVAQAMNAARSLTVSTRPFPLAGHRDVYAYTDQVLLGGTERVEAQSWTLSYGDSTSPPADMTHVWRTVS